MPKSLVILALIILVAPQSFASSTYRLTCKTMSIPTSSSPGTLLNPILLNLTVSEDPSAPYGFVARYAYGSQKDTAIETYKALPWPADFLAMSESYGPFILGYSIKDVAQLVVVNIGVEANKTDALGLSLWVTIDSNGQTLGKFTRAGEALGVCDIR